jgi:hypothetical protein
MLNAAFSSAPHITLEMLAKGMARSNAEDSNMLDANYDSVMTTNTSIGGVLHNLDRCESARMEKANPFRETMDSVTSQTRPPRLGGNELFNSHLDSLREALMLPQRPRAPSSIGAPTGSSTDRYGQPAPGSTGVSSASGTVANLVQQPMHREDINERRAA